MTEKQYKKYIVNVNTTVIKTVWCPICKNKNICNAELKEKCCIRYFQKSHKNGWTLENALAKENEKEKALKEKINEVKKKLKERKND